MSQYKTSDNFPSYTQDISGEFPKRVTCYYTLTNIIYSLNHKRYSK